MHKILQVAPEFELRQPLSLSEIEEWQTASGLRLPGSYVEFLLLSNGGEGPIGEGGYLMLWPLELLLVESKQLSGIADRPIYLSVGSNGGGESLVINFDSSPVRVGFLPNIDSAPSNFVVIDDDFWEALVKIGADRTFDQ
jgi:hypothetical protein